MSPISIRRFWTQTIRRSFISGLLVVVPVAITVTILIKLFHLADGLLQPWLTSNTPLRIPGLGILITLAVIFLVGLVTRNYVAQKLLRLGERVVVHLPLAGSIYGSIKEILGAFAGEDSERVKKVVIVPYPAAGLWAFGFLNGTLTLDNGRRMGLVLILNSINPTTGLLSMLPLDTIHAVDLTAEQAMKLIISGGIVTPERLATVPADGA